MIACVLKMEDIKASLFQSNMDASALLVLPLIGILDVAMRWSREQSVQILSDYTL